MNVIGSVIEEQGVTFGVVLVKKHVFNNTAEANRTIESVSTDWFGGLPVVLAAQDSKGHFEFYGRKDITNFLASSDPTQIPWSEYKVS